MNQHIEVLYITYDGLCDPLGQSQVVPYLIALAKKNIKIYILSFEKKGIFKKTNLLNKTEQILCQNAIKWQRLKYHKNLRLLATLYDVIYGYICGLLLINRHQLNIIHARGYVSAFIASCLKKTTRIKFIFDMRGFWVEEKVDAGFWSKKSIGYKLAKSLEKVMLDSADRIVVLTEKARLFLASQIPKKNDIIEVIPTCVDLNNFKPLEGLKKDSLQDKLVILYSGSIGTFYGFKDAVEFFKVLLGKEQRSFFLGLINNQPDAAENILKADGLPPHSYRILSLNHMEVSNWVKEADVSLIFYHRDNSYAGCWPTKFAESLACGVPVIANKNIGDCDDIIEKEKIGFILEDFTNSEYKKVIDKFLPVLKDRDLLRIRCRNVAERLFSLDNGIKRYLNIYNRLYESIILGSLSDGRTE
jgi:glycosyltransferase involved in cell wall biosynthesis